MERPILKPAPEVITREYGDEYVLYHRGSGHTASLTGVAAQVWRHALGGPTPTASAAEIDQANAELVELGFLVQPSGISRRVVIGGALIGGTAATLSGLAAIVAPLAA